MFYDLGADLKRHENSEFKDKPCHVNCDCGRFIEIGNSVFMEYERTEKGFKKLAQQNVDFGGGLERTVMVVQGKDNIFETDLFNNILSKIEELSGGKKYRENMKAFEIIADHLKASTFIMGDNKGISPSNTGQGYIVRRLIRRAIRYGKQIGITKELWAEDIAQIIIGDYSDVYPELSKNTDFIISELKKEEQKFKKTLEKGEQIVKEFNEIDGKTAFDLYQSYGFPLELTKEILKEEKKEIHNEQDFFRALKEHQDLSRTASAGMFKGGLADAGEETKQLHTAAHLMLSALRKVLGDHVVQKGSNITAERLRFDFSHPSKMTPEQIKEVENIVNENISKNLPVVCEEMNLDEAKEKNAMGVFESKYGERVKVYTVGENNNIASREICGGPHVENTRELGKFKIQKEESSSSGVRRIKAVLE